MKLTTILNAWASEYYGSDKLSRLLDGSAECIQGLSLIEPKYDMSDTGYVFVGHATVTVDVMTASMLTGRASALQAQQKRITAEAAAKVAQIEREIQQLLAICMK